MSEEGGNNLGENLPVVEGRNSPGGNGQPQLDNLGSQGVQMKLHKSVMHSINNISINKKLS